MEFELGGAHPRGPQAPRFKLDGTVATRETNYHVYKPKGAGNNNNVYTDLAHPGLFDTADDALIAVFSTERDFQCLGGCAPESAEATTPQELNFARNLAMVKIPLDLNNRTLLGDESGGFTTFGADSARFSAVVLAKRTVSVI